MDKSIFIHVGPGKTGTSAIQYWCRKNRAFLAQEGILYPDHLIDKNGVGSGHKELILSRDREGRLVVDSTKVKSLLKNYGNSAHSKLVITSEFFSDHVQVLHDHFPDAEFIWYLRHPIDAMESGYNQSVKRAGETRGLGISKKSGFATIDRLEKLLQGTNKPEILIRPFASSLFVGGSLVSDFLSVLGINLTIENDQKINTSYSFDALEFKRNANFFPLGELHNPLDTALQVCPLGVKKFSLIEPGAYEVLKKRLVARLDDFLTNNGLEYLRPFKDQVEQRKQKQWCQQTLERKEMFKVADYLKSNSPALYAAMAELVRSCAPRSLPNPEFYECFEVKMPDEKDLNEIEAIRKLAARFSVGNSFEEADLCRELAVFFEELGRQDMAWKFMEVAYDYRPKGPFIRKKLAEYRLLRNQNSNKIDTLSIRGHLLTLMTKFRN